MKEIKCFYSHNGFFPQNYLEGSLTSDAKGLGVNGDAIKTLKKGIEQNLLTLSETEYDLDSRCNQRRELTTQLFDALGYYKIDKAPKYNKSRELTIRGKRLSIPVDASYLFKGEGELWLLHHCVELNLSQIDDESDIEIEQTPEFFFDEPAESYLKDKPHPEALKDVIEAIFDGDQTDCEFLIISTGDKLYLLERGKWQEGPQSYLELNLSELYTAINSQAYYQLAESLFSPKAFPIESAENFHETLERNAHKKAVEVTKALRDTVRESIEIIASEVLSKHYQQPLINWENRNLENPDDRQVCAEELFDQTLKYIYRMLFMFFSESQDQAKGALPVQSRAYQHGYSIEKLRDLELKPFLIGKSENSHSSFIFESLSKSFKVYHQGYNINSKSKGDDEKTNALGFSFPSLGTKLFADESTPLINEATLPDHILQTVLAKLSLAKPKTGKDKRPFRVHYAGLGLNQLGAVYEGLLTLKPMILSEKVVLLKRDKSKNEIAHRFVPYSKRGLIEEKQLEFDDEGTLNTKDKGSFILAPVGLERKFSASYYTPEVLTRFLAKEAVNTMLGERPTLDQMENLKILEPAMGSGAFLNAVVDEIAPRMAKLYEKPDLERYEAAIAKLKAENKENNPIELAKIRDLKPYSINHYISKAKDHLMRHSIYGVDLNQTAVELAKISLWLNCLHEHGNLPFLDMKLRFGNSLVGAWVKQFQNKDTGLPHWFYPTSQMLEPHLEGHILANKKRPFIESKEEVEKIKSIGKTWDAIATDKAANERLKYIYTKVLDLYEEHNLAKTDYQERIRKTDDPKAKDALFSEYTSSNSAYNQLRAMMDMWCALWFWPNDKLTELPSAMDYLKALEWISKTPLKYGLDQKEQLIDSGLGFLVTAREAALANKFLHYDLEFSDVFEEKGGFDLILGNPPWSRVRWTEDDFFSSIQFMELPKGKKEKYEAYFDEMSKHPQLSPEQYKSKNTTINGLVNFLHNSKTYDYGDKGQTTTDKYFLQRFWKMAHPAGTIASITAETIITEKASIEFRTKYYSSLLKLFRFYNFDDLFEGVGGNQQFCVSIANNNKVKLGFKLLDCLLHPSIVEKCLNESAAAPYTGGLKNSEGDWNMKGHPLRFIEANEDVFSIYGSTENADYSNSILPLFGGQPEADCQKSLFNNGILFDSMEKYYRSGFHESGDVVKGLIKKESCRPKNKNHIIVNGPCISVGNPIHSEPRIPCKSKFDYEKNDLTTTAFSYLPAARFKLTPKGETKSIELTATSPWGEKHVDQFRMAGTAGLLNQNLERTYTACIFPPGRLHTYTIGTYSFKDIKKMAYATGILSSILYDFVIRTTCGQALTANSLNHIKVPDTKSSDSLLVDALIIRTLRLNCLTREYSPLWKELYSENYKIADLPSNYQPEMPYSDLSKDLKTEYGIRDAKSREQTLCEIDAIVSHLTGTDLTTLQQLYRSHFGILQKKLQDLPNQVIDEEKYHFPRYRAMAEAYNHFSKLAASSSKSKVTSLPKRKAKKVQPSADRGVVNE